MTRDGKRTWSDPAAALKLGLWPKPLFVNQYSTEGKYAPLGSL